MDAFTKLWPFAAKQKSDRGRRGFGAPRNGKRERNLCLSEWPSPSFAPAPAAARSSAAARRSEEHTSELQSLMRTSYAVFCLQKKQTNTHIHHIHYKVYLHTTDCK